MPPTVPNEWLPAIRSAAVATALTHWTRDRKPPLGRRHHIPSRVAEDALIALSTGPAPRSHGPSPTPEIYRKSLGPLAAAIAAAGPDVARVVSAFSRDAAVMAMARDKPG